MNFIGLTQKPLVKASTICRSLTSLWREKNLKLWKLIDKKQVKSNNCIIKLKRTTLLILKKTQFSKAFHIKQAQKYNYGLVEKSYIKIQTIMHQDWTLRHALLKWYSISGYSIKSKRNLKRAITKLFIYTGILHIK